MFLINGIPGFQIMNASGVATFIATGDLRDGSYHHLAVTMDRNSTTGGKIYVDGTAILTFNPTVLSGSLANNDPVRIGVQFLPTLKRPKKTALFTNETLIGKSAAAIQQTGYDRRFTSGVLTRAGKSS